MRGVIVVVALIVSATPLFAEELKAQRDIAYAGTKHPRQTLDMYASTVKAAGKGRPVAVWIHGGGWQVGDKKEVDHKPQAFVDRGWVFVSVNYRMLGDKVTINQMAQDVAKAIRWTYDHARDYGGDPDLLFVTGHSAGAQLAALVCTDERYLKAEKLALAAVKGCVPVDGDTYDVPLQIATVEDRRAKIYRQKFGDAASQKALSPISHVAKGKHIPPTLVLHVADHPEVRMQSQKLVKAMQQAGVPARAYPAEKTHHVKINADLGVAGDRVTHEMFEFLEAHVPRTPAYFRARMSRSLTPATAEAAFGKPDRDIGSGLMIYEYALRDGSKVLLGFPGQAKILYARHQKTKDGKADDLLPKK